MARTKQTWTRAAHRAGRFLPPQNDYGGVPNPRPHLGYCVASFSARPPRMMMMQPTRQEAGGVEEEGGAGCGGDQGGAVGGTDDDDDDDGSATSATTTTTTTTTTMTDPMVTKPNGGKTDIVEDQLELQKLKVELSEAQAQVLKLEAANAKLARQVRQGTEDGYGTESSQSSSIIVNTTTTDPRGTHHQNEDGSYTTGWGGFAITDEYQRQSDANDDDYNQPAVCDIRTKAHRKPLKRPCV